MTLAASISLTACALELGVGLLSLALAGAPGWRHLRLLAFIAFTASAYSASNIPQTLGVAPAVVIWSSRVSLAMAALNLAAWIVYTAPRAGERARLGRLDRGLVTALALAAALSFWPGLLAGPKVLTHEVAWLGLRYATAEPTALTDAVFGLFFAGMGIAAWRFLRSVRERAPGARAHALGFAVLLAAGINEGLVAARLIAAPYLLDLGFLAVVLPITGAVSRRLVGGTRSLAHRSSQLEGDVAAARRALEETERSFGEIFEATREAIAVHDLGSRRVLQVNQALVELVGRPREELVSPEARPFDGEPPYSAAEAAERMRQAVEEGPQRFEWRVRSSEGKVQWLDVQLVAARIQGRPCVVASMRDITARKEAEVERERLQEQLLQSRKLESIGRLAGGVAHDFNNLLTVILSCTDVLREDLASGEAVNPDDVAEIHAAAERARGVTRQLLAFARRQVVAPVVLDLNAAARGSDKLLKRVLGEQVVQRLELAPEAWLVHIDPGQLEQVILNLALNARDAMPRGGTLTLETRNLPAGAALPDGTPAPADRVRLTVRDTGTGIAPEVQAHLFEPFFTTKGHGLGTGLGLATVHGIVSQCGGQVQVESLAGQGSAFHVILPRAVAPAAEVAAARPPPPRAVGGSETLLLVEDERPVREVTARALRGAGYKVLEAGDGPEALAALERHSGRIDALVTDVIMPGMDGRALADEVQRRRGRLAVLYVSGYSHEVISHRGILDPGVHFLAKPYAPDALLASVRAAIDEAAS